MFNGSIKEEALKNLKESQKDYQEAANRATESSVALFEQRKYCSEILIRDVEEYFNSISNVPIEFDKGFSEIKAQFWNFDHMIEELKKEADEVNVDVGASVAAGVAGGAGVAAFAPTAAMAIATTFGTASTGTAISTLSGAAATKAAVAWLGGGALAAGGGGMAAGNALLLLAGPAGWIIGGATLLGGTLLARNRNANVAEEANSVRGNIELGKAALKFAHKELDGLFSQTVMHRNSADKQLKSAKLYIESDFDKMPDEQKNILMILKNDIESLSTLIQMKIEVKNPM